jgi:hypothetical protein
MPPVVLGSSPSHPFKRSIYSTSRTITFLTIQASQIALTQRTSLHLCTNCARMTSHPHTRNHSSTNTANSILTLRAWIYNLRTWLEHVESDIGLSQHLSNISSISCFHPASVSACAQGFWVLWTHMDLAWKGEQPVNVIATAFLLHSQRPTGRVFVGAPSISVEAAISSQATVILTQTPSRSCQRPRDRIRTSTSVCIMYSLLIIP